LAWRTSTRRSTSRRAWRSCRNGRRSASRVRDELRVAIASDSDVVAARREARALASELNFTSTDITLLATAISEIARNITTYAGEGEIVLSVVQNDDRAGIRVVARDDGPGIRDVERAMEDGYS